MGPKSEPGPTLFRTFFPATIAVACLANLVILLIRLYFTVHHSDLFETSGTEGVGIYAVWKAKNGYPLYEWPDSGAFAMSIFNYLLYTMDGFLLRVFHIADNHVPSMARLITFAFAVGGVFAHRAVVRQIMPKALCNRAVSITAWLLIVSMWIGRSSVSWWTLTVRPDIPALALDVIGLLFLIRSMEGKSIINTLTASVLFYLAWSMKQSFVLTISISCLFLLVSRRYRETLWLCVPFAAMCAVTLVIGGPVFRRNMLYMPTLAPFGLRSGLVNLATWVVFNPIFWMPACFLPWAWRGVAGRITPGQAQPRFDDRRRLMLIVMLAAISLPLSFVASCRVGANYNYFFVPLVHLTTLSIVVVAWCMSAERGPIASAARTAALAAGAWAIALPTLMLIFPQGIGDHLTWNLVFPRAVQGQRRAFVDALKSAPRPMLIDDSMIAQPWLATGDTYPALVTDSEIFMLAQQKGLIPKDVRSQLVLRGVYRSAVAPRDSDIALALIARGFSSRTLPIYVSPWGSTGEMVLLIRPADQTHAPATR